MDYAELKFPITMFAKKLAKGAGERSGSYELVRSLNLSTQVF